MKRRTKNFHAKSIWGIICIVFISLITTSTSSAQNNLIPGYWGSSDNYELALKTVFSEAYDRSVRVRVQIQSKYGIENITGIRADTTGYYVFHIIPEESVWYNSWVEVPCKDSEGNKLPENTGRTCKSLDFSSVDTIRVNNFQTAIDSSLAQKLISLWEEMLVQSSYKQKTNIISTGGTTYQYSAFKFGLGNIQGYSRNPEKDTYTGVFSSISSLMRDAARVESEQTTDSLLSIIDSKSDNLMQELLSYGDKAPTRAENIRTLRGCTDEYRNIVDSNYCWQAYLTDDENPNLIIANNINGEYVFEFIDLSDPDEMSKIHVLPVISIHSPYKRGENFTGWQNYLLEPWDIVDLMTNTRNNELQVFGYKEFTLENENIYYRPNSVIIQFDGLLSNRDRRVRLDINGNHEWFRIMSLFKND